MTNENGDLDVVMGSTESLNLDVTLTTGHGTAQMGGAASALFSADVYLANDAAGQQPQGSKTQATVTSTSIVIEPDVGVDEEPVVINVAADVNLDDLNCDDYHYVCVDFTSFDTSEWTWKDGDTTAKTACVEITSCLGQIVGTTSIDKNDAASEDLVVVMGPERAFHLDVEVAVTAGSASATVDAVGTNMFDIKVYLASDDQGSGSSEYVNATNLPTTDVTLSKSTSPETLSDIQATLDLDGFACEDFSHVCALIVPKDYSPSEPWIWVDSSASDTACVAIATSTACSIQVTEETITVVATDGTNLDIQMGSTKDFSLDITLVTGDDTGELSLQAAQMFSVELYLAADVNGSSPSTEESATLPADSVTIDNRTTTGPVTATVSGYNLADLSCASYTHVCVDVAPVVDSKWAWTSGDEAKTACVALGICTSVITAGSVSAIASDKVVRMGTNKLFNLDVTIEVVDTSAVVTGPEASLYHIQVFLASGDDGANPSAKYNATITSSEAGATMSVASPDTVISDVTVQINLEGQSCVDFQYVCVEVKPHHTATWSWDDVGTSAKLACDPTAIDCSSEIRADSVTLSSNQAGDLDVIMGGSEDFRLDITIETGAETAKIEGNADELFAVNVYLATGNGQSGGAESAREAATVQSDATIINPSSTITISDVTLTDFDLLGKGCDDYSYVCVDVSPATGAEWLWSTAALINACVQIADCSAILSASSLALSGTSGSIVVAMGAPQTFVLDVTITTGASNTGKVTGTPDQLFTVDVYLATDDAGTGNTDKVRAVLPSSAFTVKDSDVQAITGIQATVDLSQSECDSYSHVCADVTTLSADVWEWYGTPPDPTCVAYTDCTTAPTISTTVANNNAGTLAVIMGESKTFHLDVTATLSLGDAISGENLYSVSAYLATDQQGSNPKPSNKVVGTITDNDIGFSDVSPATLTDVTATMDFSDLITCQQSANQNYGYVCVDLSENPAAVPTWSATASSSMTGCVALSPPCQSQPLLDFTLSGLQIISPSNKKVIVGENVEVVFDVTVQLDANSGSANGNDNWEIEGFLSTSATGAVKTAKVPATAASMASHIGHDMDGGDSYTFEDVVVDLPLGPTDCGDLGYFCVELSQGGAADWYFDPFNPSTNVACTAVTCTTAGDATVQTMSLSLGIVSLLVTVWINL
ncbi:streptococcal hemagglutinin-like [Ptychodera flava]|uniref:streptococcal hemagglutinin-like n=1 Tax=Ptychodera flava TaxID=63121 RepID=UPI00396A6D6D